MISSNMKKSYCDCTYQIPGCGVLSELQTTFETFYFPPFSSGVKPSKISKIELLLGAALMGLGAKCVGEVRDRASGTKGGLWEPSCCWMRLLEAVKANWVSMGVLVLENVPSDVYKHPCLGMTWMPDSPGLLLSTDPFFGCVIRRPTKITFC